MSETGKSYKDIVSARADFPLLSRKVNGKNVVYLDTAASALKPWPVIERLSHFYSFETANVHRGAHFLSDKATESYEFCRGKVMEFVNASDSNEIIFTTGTTGSVNLVAQAWGGKNLQSGDEILLSELEHHSNIVPWQMVAEKVGAKIKVIPITKEGDLDYEKAKSLINSKTKILAVTHCSNVLGTVIDIKKFANAIHQVGGLIFVDGAQMIANAPVDVRALDVDFYAFSAHKMFGPYGVGVLYGKEKILEEMPPFLGGGSMIHEVTFEKTTYHDLPHKFEAGTPNISGVLGLNAAIDYLRSFSWEQIRLHEQKLLNLAAEKLYKSNLPVTFYGKIAVGNNTKKEEVSLLNIDSALSLSGLSEGKKESLHQGPVLSFNLGKMHSHDIGQLLSQMNIAVRCGHHCAQPLMKALGIKSTIRASFSIYNNESDVETFVNAVEKAEGMLK